MIIAHDESLDLASRYSIVHPLPKREKNNPRKKKGGRISCNAGWRMLIIMQRIWGLS